MAPRKIICSPELPERNIKVLAEQAKGLKFRKRGKLKNYTKERIADLYLNELAKDGDTPIFINEFLDEKGIFCTYESIIECLELLSNCGFIKEVNLGFSVFKISKAKDIWARRIAEAWRIPQYVITDAGFHFAIGGQKLDTSSIEEEKKWKERVIQWAGTIAIALLTMTVKECVFDKKNESSYLHPRLDQGQGPVHRQPVARPAPLRRGARLGHI